MNEEQLKALEQFCIAFGLSKANLAEALLTAQSTLEDDIEEKWKELCDRLEAVNKLLEPFYPE